MQIFASDRLILTMYFSEYFVNRYINIHLNTVKQPSLFTDGVFNRQIVLEHVMEQVEQSKTVFNY